jgi:CheY-like chemotaxis protein/predicted RNA-binding Zn-ribbon protein involved in translation (DUF1610 family)
MAKSSVMPLVLLVDTHQDTLELYRCELESAGFRVLTEQHPADALSTARDVRPAAVVTELVLPDISGVTFARALRDLPETTDTSVIAVSGMARSRDVSAAERAGCSAVLVKPCLPDELAATLQRVLAASRDRRARSQSAGARAAMLRARSERVLFQGAVIRSRRAALAGDDVPVPCPACGGELRWRDQQMRQGARFDYFYPCPSGCGEYYFHHGRRLMRLLRS